MSDNNSKSMGDLFPDLGPEAPVISGVAHDRSEALATVRGVPNEPGMAAKVFTELAAAGVNVDMIVQAGASVGTAEISFTVPESTVKEVENVLIDKHDELGYKSFDVNPERRQGRGRGRWHEDPFRPGGQVLHRSERQGHQRADDLHVRDPHRGARPARPA